MKAVIVVPTYNEADNIKNFLQKLMQVRNKLKKWKLEVLVVDDNSPDKTWKIVQEEIKKKSWLYLLKRNKKVGLGAAYLAGMENAFNERKADVVLTMDADLSHNPLYIPKFLEKIEKGSDLVIGSRYITGGSIPQEWALHRKIYSILGNKAVSFFLGFEHISDWTSGYRALTKNVFIKVKYQVQSRITQGYTFNISFAYNTLIMGFQVDHLPIKFPDRMMGKSKLGFEYLIHTPIFLIKTRLKRN